MQYVSILPSIFALIPRVDVSDKSPDTEGPKNDSFGGILSKTVSDNKTAAESAPRQNEERANEVPEPRHPEQDRSEDRERLEDDEAVDAEGRTDEKAESQDADSENPHGDDGKQQNEETSEDGAPPEQAQDGEEETSEDGSPPEQAQDGEEETSEDGSPPAQAGDTEEETSGPAEGENVPAETQRSRVLGQQPAAPESPAIPESDPEAQGEKPHSDETPGEEPVAQSARDSEIRTSNLQTVSADRTSRGQMLIEPGPETPTAPGNQANTDLPPARTENRMSEKAADMVEQHSKSAPEDKVNMKPEVPLGREISELAKEYEKRDIGDIIRAHLQAARQTRTNDPVADEGFRILDSTQTGQPAPAPEPLIRYAETQLDLTADAHTSTNPRPENAKPTETNADFEAAMTEAAKGPAERAARTANPESARPGQARTVEIERSVLGQIRGAMSTLRSGKSELFLQLRPPELGSVRIRLTLENSILTARIVVSSENVRTIVERHLDDLRNSLAEEGVKIERFEVSVDQRNDRQASANSSGNDRHNAEEDRISKEDATSGNEENETKLLQAERLEKVKAENRRLHILA